MRRPALTTLALGGLAAMLVAASSPAASSGSRAKLWSADGGRITCGVEIHPNGPAKSMLCSARSIPAPTTGPKFGDPGFVTLGASTGPTLIRTSQDMFEAATAVSLPAGAKWSVLNIMCVVGPASVRCTNHSGHGFTIGSRSYKSH